MHALTYSRRSLAVTVDMLDGPVTMELFPQTVNVLYDRDGVLHLFRKVDRQPEIGGLPLFFIDTDNKGVKSVTDLRSSPKPVK